MEYSLSLETPAIQVPDPKFPVARARSAVIQELSSEIIRFLTGWDYILEANHTVA